MYISNNNQQTQSNKQNVPKSPNLPRKPNNEKFLSEVEEKLKAMRQKRLSRLSAFVDEQSKLSEERSRSSDGEDMDQAIMSIQKEPARPKPSFKTIAEETGIEKHDDNKSRIESVELKQNAKNLTASTIKFINKFSCVGVDVRSSVDYNISDRDSLYLPRHAPGPKQDGTEENDKARNKMKFFQRNTINFPDNFSIDADKNSQENFSKTLPHANTHSALCGINDVEDKKDLVKTGSGDLFVRHINKTDTKRNSLSDFAAFNNENVVGDGFDRLMQQPMTTFGKSTSNLTKVASEPFLETIGLETEGKTLQGESKVPETHTVGTNGIDKYIKEYTNASQTNTKIVPGISIVQENRFRTEKINERKQQTITKTLSPKPIYLQPKQIHAPKVGISEKKTKTFTLPLNPGSNKKASKEERILKKLQRNWDTVNEILDNDSDVDADEMEDLKNIVGDSKNLLLEYERRLNDLEYKKQPTLRYKKKLNDIIDKLKETEAVVNKFKGLGNDDECVEIKSRLSEYAVEVEKIPGLSEEKSVVVSAVENCTKTLENKINRHEVLLRELLEEQADLIGSRHLAIIV